MDTMAGSEKSGRVHLTAPDNSNSTFPSLQGSFTRGDAMTEVEEHSSLEKVTDFVEEKELDNEETMNALSSLADPAQALISDKHSSVEPTFKISAADVDMIIAEMEITKEEAHAALLREKGDVVQALRHLCR